MFRKKILYSSILSVLACASPAMATTTVSPEPTACVKGVITPTAGSCDQYYCSVALTITNTCAAAVDMQNATVTFKMQSALNTNFWGEFSNLAYPQNTQITSQKQADDNLASLVLQFPKADWANTKLAKGSSIKIQYGSQNAGKFIADSVKVYLNDGPKPEPTAELQLHLGEKPAGMKESITQSKIEVDNNEGRAIAYVDLPWGKSESIKELPSGKYKILPGNIEGFAGTATPSEVILDVQDATKKTGSSNIVYTAIQPPVGKVNIRIKQLPELPGYLSDQTITLKNNTGQWEKTIPWKAETTLLDGLPNKASLELHAPNVIFKDQLCVPQFDQTTVVTDDKTPQTRQLSYQCEKRTVPVKVNVNGIAGDTPVQAVKVTFSPANLEDKVTITVNKENDWKANTWLLKGSVYTVSSDNIPGYTASFDPRQLTPTQGGLNEENISYKKGSPAKFVVYWAGWFASDMSNLATLPYPANVINMSFGDITQTAAGYQVDTSVSGWITNVPAKDARLQPTYYAWTRFKHAHPEVKMMLSIGGATFHHIWTNLLTPENVDAVATAIAKVINQSYPVYEPDFAKKENLIGEVNIDGVDIDPEADVFVAGYDATGKAIPTQQAKNIAALITALKAKLAPGKYISMAGFSVGADKKGEETCPGSMHIGENIHTLETAGHLLDWVNVMNYDAGIEYAKSKYKDALDHYARFIGKEKTLLGLDVETQWGGFRETPAELAAKARWEKENGFAGSMFWAHGYPGSSEALTAISAELK